MAFIGTVLTAIVTALLFVIRQRNEEIQLIQNKLSDKKYAVYSEVLTILFDVMYSQKGLRILDKDELPKRLLEVKKNLIIYAPDEIFKKFLDWNVAAQKAEGLAHSLLFFELILLIRKDMGNKFTTVTIDDIIRSIVKVSDFDEFKKTLYMSKTEYEYYLQNRNSPTN